MIKTLSVTLFLYIFMCSCITASVLHYYPDYSFVKTFQTPKKGGVIELQVESKFILSPPPQIITDYKVAYIRGYIKVLKAIKTFCKDQTYTIQSSKDKSRFSHFMSYLDNNPTNYINIITMFPHFEDYKEIKFECKDISRFHRKSKSKKVKNTIIL